MDEVNPDVVVLGIRLPPARTGDDEASSEGHVVYASVRVVETIVGGVNVLSCQPVVADESAPAPASRVVVQTLHGNYQRDSWRATLSAELIMKTDHLRGAEPNPDA